VLVKTLDNLLNRGENGETLYLSSRRDMSNITKGYWRGRVYTADEVIYRVTHEEGL